MNKANTFAKALTAGAALALALGVTAANAQTPAKPSGMPGMSSPSSSVPAGGMDMKAMMKDMSEKMNAMQMTGNQDVDFAMMMRIHHQGAIAMAQMELDAGKEAPMKKMAKDIVSAQKKEIAEIDKFLAKHGPKK